MFALRTMLCALQSWEIKTISMTSGKKLHSQMEKLIGQNAGDNVKVLGEVK